MDMKEILSRIFRTANPDDPDADSAASSLASNQNLYPIFGRIDPNNAKLTAQPEGFDAGDTIAGDLTPGTSTPTAQPTDPRKTTDPDADIKMDDPRGPLPGDLPGSELEGTYTWDKAAAPAEDLPPIPDASKLQWDATNDNAAASGAPKKAAVPKDASATLPLGPSDADPSLSDENAEREKLHADLDKRQKILGTIGAFGGSLGDAIENTGVAFGGPGAKQDTADQVQKTLQAKKEEEEGDFEKKLLNDPNSATSQNSRAMLLKISPDLGKDPSFGKMTAQMVKDKMPFFDTFIKAQAAKDAKEFQLEYLKTQRANSASDKHNAEQDRLEAQATNRLSQLRGDASLARTELQRDASSNAYTILEKAKQEGRTLTKPEYYDLLGQLWQARTGKAPTDEALRDLDIKTVQGDMNKMASYFGVPKGATTPEVLNNLQQFVRQTGEAADKAHDAYMAPHLIKPTGLDDDRWQPILSTQRGRSFSSVMQSMAPKGPTGPAQKIGRFSVVVH